MAKHLSIFGIAFSFLVGDGLFAQTPFCQGGPGVWPSAGAYGLTTFGDSRAYVLGIHQQPGCVGK